MLGGVDRAEAPCASGSARAECGTQRTKCSGCWAADGRAVLRVAVVSNMEYRSLC